MYDKNPCRRNAVFQRSLKPFKKQESHEVKEYGNCCCNLQKKALLTGISEIAKSKRCPRMAIKLFVVFLCTSGFLYQTWTFLQIYLAYPTTLDISEEYPDSFLAPAITVCNRNRLLRQPYCKTYPEKCTWEHTTWESFCKMYRRMCPNTKPPDFNFGIPVFNYLLTPNRSNAVLNAASSTEQSNIISEFDVSGSENLNSTFMIINMKKNGLPYRCFSLFSLLLNYNKETFNRTLADGYLIVLDLHPEEYFNTFDLVQASVVLHDPRKLVNPMTEGITLTSGKMYRLFSTMERRESLPLPYSTDCFDYLAQWKENGGHGPLSKDDCINQCKIHVNVMKFGCVGQSMTYSSLHSYTICEHPSYEITAEEYRKCATYCPDACEENIYHITVDDAFDFSGAVWHGWSSRKTHTGERIILKNSVVDLQSKDNRNFDKQNIFSNPCDMRKKCPPTDEHCKSRFMYIYVSFNRMKIQKFKQIPRFESIELFSYVGGYLGLWLGISLASVFDLAQMIYDIIYDAFKKRKRNKKRTMLIKKFQHHTAVKKQKNIVKRTILSW